MLKASITHLKRYKTVLFIIFSLFFFLLGLILHFHNQEVVTQTELVQVLTLQSQEQKCQQAYVRLTQKLNEVNSRVANQEILVAILVLYETASKLSLKNDVKCLILEQWGDDVWMAYRQGVRDGKKASSGGV